ncbi:hypothetical protein SBA4_1660007 [Candidatus Sulfopaludibacter sp. SbA4]|nr:hypothetical protein SBA4_1660007 [Candidatus Sulfopaludibacter sp. SbA4]
MPHASRSMTDAAPAQSLHNRPRFCVKMRSEVQIEIIAPDIVAPDHGRPLRADGGPVRVDADSQCGVEVLR